MASVSWMRWESTPVSQPKNKMTYHQANSAHVQRRPPDAKDATRPPWALMSDQLGPPITTAHPISASHLGASPHAMMNTGSLSRDQAVQVAHVHYHGYPHQPGPRLDGHGAYYAPPYKPVAFDSMGINLMPSQTTHTAPGRMQKEATLAMHEYYHGQEPLTKNLKYSCHGQYDVPEVRPLPLSRQNRTWRVIDFLVFFS